MPIYQIRIPMPQKYRSKITKVVLDWVESWPKCKDEYIRSLQHEREHQREEGQKTFEETRPPVGTKLEFLAIQMIDVFQYEEFDALRINLERMFPDLDGFRSGEPFKNAFEEFSSTLTQGAWINIGWIYRDKKPMGPRNVVHLPNLPPEVTDIEVGLHQILPSIIVISYYIHLSDSTSIQLRNLQGAKYLPEAKIERLFIKEKLFGLMHWTSDRSMEQTITNWVTRIRVDIESVIRPHFSGDFMKQPTGITKLPAIEIYGLKVKASLTTQKGFISWVNSARKWWGSLQFQLNFQTFNNNKLAFSWAHRSYHDDTLISHRILLFWKPYLKDINLEMYGGSEKWAMINTTHYFLNNILMLFTAIEVLNHHVEKVKKFRATIYLNMAKGKLGKPNLRRQLALYGDLQQTIRQTERFLLEFDQAQKFIEKEFNESNPEKMIRTNLYPEIKQSSENFKDNVFSRVYYLRKTLDNHLNFLNKTFSTYVEFLNTDAVYNLQIVSVVLSAIALIATVFGLLGNWKDIVELFRILVKLFI